jgi:hypothetical protein
MAAITVHELRAITTILLDHLEANGDVEIELKRDYYWNIPNEQIYHLLSEPTNLTVGQLYDDWHNLQELLKPDGDPIAYHLVWLAAILRYVGQELVA